MDSKLVFNEVKKGINSGDFVLIDVRSPDEVRNDGKIPSSHLIPREYIFYIFMSKILKNPLTFMIARYLLKLFTNECSFINVLCTTIPGHFFTICVYIFHKTEVLTVILRCLTGLIYYWLKSYDAKRIYFHFFLFLRFCTKTDICIFFVFYVFVFFVITFVPIKIWTHSAP